MPDQAAIVLAQEKPFRLGPLQVRPAVREVVHDDGRRETLEPRVMQVLVALVRASGEIVTRSDLTESCWEGRVVGEDAINRVISRLHRLAADFSGGAFRIETITKVGYRLNLEGAGDVGPQPVAEVGPGVSRRALWMAIGIGGAVAAAGGLYVWRGARRVPLSAETRALYDQAWIALGQSSPEQAAQAVGLFKRVVEVSPDYADGWGSLAYAYAVQSDMADPALVESLRTRSRAAVDKAHQLAAANAYADAASAELNSIFGNWLKAENAYRAAIKRHERAAPLVQGLSQVLLNVGRMIESAAQLDTVSGLLITPRSAYRQALSLWAANRIEESEKLIGRAIELFPRSVPVWFTYFNIYARSGNPDLAMAFGEDRTRRPTGVPDRDFEVALLSARALQSKAPADIERAVAMNLSLAEQGRGYAENAIQWTAALGRLDQAFAVAERYYFAGPTAGPAFSSEQGEFYVEPRTHFLFYPPCEMLRGDPRFETLVQRIGLKAYWEASKSLPDYQKGRR